MIDLSMAYAILHALAAAGDRRDALFGRYEAQGWDAFGRGVAGSSFPELWFELPLLGEPWFDLHVNTDRDSPALRADQPPAALADRPELFAWFAGAEGVRQLALSFDSHTGQLDNPGVELLVSDEDQHLPFLEMLGGPEAAATFAAFRQRKPEGWFVCYTGIFAGREGAGVRVECIPKPTIQRAYAKDSSLLERDLRQVGFEALSDEVIAGCQRLAGTSYGFECQFNVFADGSLSDMLGTSLRFANPDGPEWAIFGRGPATEELMALLEDWGLADERWRQLADVAFAKRIQRDGSEVVVSIFPAFVKLRWKAGEPLDAKTYLNAGIS